MKDPLLCDFRGKVIGDHNDIYSVLKPEKLKKQLSFRQFRKFNTEDLSSDLNKLLSFIFKSDDIPLKDHVENYNSVVRDVVDTRAPLLSEEITIRPNTK